jgi:queuine tRNA-ribosyltransferase
MFDCVLPTRMARNGTALTRRGRLVARSARYARDEAPLDPDCACPTCRGHSRAYLRHLFQAGEMLGPMLTTLHNLHYYQELMAGLRHALREGRLATHAAGALAQWRDGERERRAEIARRSD